LEVRREQIETVVEKLLATENIDSVYLGGSLTAGLGSPRSDADLFVVLRDKGDRPDEQFLSTGIGDRVDVEFRTPAHMLRIAETYETLRETARNPIQASVPLSLHDDAIRMHLGITVHDSALLRDVRNRVNADVLRQVSLGRQFIWCRGALDDLIGAREDNDSDAAHDISHELLSEALQTFLVGCGDLYWGRKWTAAKLRRSAGPSFPYDDVHSLMGYPTADPFTSLDDLIDARVRMAQSLLIAAAGCGWTTTQASRWDTWRISADRKGPTRNNYFLPFRYQDGVFIDTPDGRQLRLVEGSLLLWGQCDGGGTDEIFRRFAAAGWADSGVSTEVLSRNLDSFAELRLI
jgi:hypothetical protein